MLQKQISAFVTIFFSSHLFFVKGMFILCQKNQINDE
ncbi:hypothetical protein DBN64_08250 [Enterococcus faecalis]|nr:hypothetical protein CVT43_12175 [Enterococcus faecalis OG1RF]AZV97882.1 hypothetical protein CVT44_12175 [Enterococcus faecalis]OOC95147.1 hypothetical protein BWO99_07060 [Enterococcus faecalis ATCC 29212]EGO8432558.1 hypothetical protein [Enterococcus faecalis]EGO8458857.1 hypothetical protein [Enterococcus faecalis]